MGLYDNIKDFSVDCPECGQKVDGFQTKDMHQPYLNYLEFFKVDNFYMSCHKCDCWIEFRLNRSKIPIEFYDMTTEYVEWDK